MRNLAIGVLLVIIAIVLYSAVSRKKRRIDAAKKAFFDECDRLDITHLEGEQFLEYLETVVDKNDKKPRRTIEFFTDARNELHKRVTVPRSTSRDRRPIESIPPQS